MDPFERIGKSSAIISGVCFGLLIAMLADSAQSLSSYKIVYMAALAFFGISMLLGGISVNSSSIIDAGAYNAVGSFTMLTIPTVTTYVGMRYKLLSRSIHQYHMYMYILVGIEYLLWAIAIALWYVGILANPALIPSFLQLYASVSIYHTIINAGLTGMIVKLLLDTMKVNSGSVPSGVNNPSGKTSKIKLCVLIFAIYFALVVITGLTMAISFLTLNVRNDIFEFNNIAILCELISLFLSSKFVAIVAAGKEESTTISTTKASRETR
ncbi:hypothetical protein BKA69DRAFT_1123846 [Paraphysoderma sedebokerense]|nr:hypothetical protein BKA69DRAFT_1123846 [Paraphysoderma sedebokerense]